MRVRLFGRPGGENAQGPWLRSRARQLESRDRDDGSGSRRPHLHRAAHRRLPTRDHPPRASRRALADAGRADRAQPRDGAGAQRRLEALSRGTDRRPGGGHRARRRPQPLQGRDARAGARPAAFGERPFARRGGGDRPDDRRVAAHRPARLHARRHGRRHCARRGGVRAHRRGRAGGLAQPRGTGGGIAHRLEGIRDGGDARQGGQRRHRLLHRKHGPDGRPHGRLDHRRAHPHAHGPRIPSNARRLHQSAGEDRHRDGRLERAVGGQSERRAAHHHRDESARLALVCARVESDGLPDCEDRRPSRRRLHARRNHERHHRQDARVVRARA